MMTTAWSWCGIGPTFINPMNPPPQIVTTGNEVAAHEITRHLTIVRGVAVR